MGTNTKGASAHETEIGVHGALGAVSVAMTPRQMSLVLDRLLVRGDTRRLIRALGAHLLAARAQDGVGEAEKILFGGTHTSTLCAQDDEQTVWVTLEEAATLLRVSPLRSPELAPLCAQLARALAALPAPAPAEPTRVLLVSRHEAELIQLRLDAGLLHAGGNLLVRLAAMLVFFVDDATGYDALHPLHLHTREVEGLFNQLKLTDAEQAPLALKVLSLFVDFVEMEERVADAAAVPAEPSPILEPRVA